LRRREQAAKVEEEVSIMQQLVSPYIIQFIASFRTSREFILGEFPQDRQGVHSG
jgi:hypothetical protein